MPRQSSRWYEQCGNEIFTEVIGPFLTNPQSILTNLPSLLLSCKFIYRIFSSCDEFWMKLLEKEYKNQLHHDETNNNNIRNLIKQEHLGKGNLIKAYFQIKFYESHLNLIPMQYLLHKTDYSNGPQFVSTSNQGYIYAEGFCNQLASGYFIEGYDPACPDNYTCSLEDGAFVRIFSGLISEEMQSIIEQYWRSSVAMIFTVVILQSDKNFDSLIKETFDGFERMCKLGKANESLDKYTISFGIHYGGKDGNYSDQYKKETQRLFCQYLAKFDLQDSIIMECDLYNREHVRKLALETLNKIKPINLCAFLPVLLDSLTKNKKKCLVM